MKMGPKNPKIYEIFDSDGTLVARGQVGDVAKAVGATPQSVWKAANGYTHLLWWRYKVKEVKSKKGGKGKK